MARVVKAHTPLGEDQLLFRSMAGTEGLSQLFEFEVELLSPSAALDLKSVLGKPLALEIQTAVAGEPRFLNGQIVRFSMVGREGGTSRHTVYRATVRPWLWYLTRSSDNKIFQDKSVVDILEEVFGDYGFAFEKQLSGIAKKLLGNANAYMEIFNANKDQLSDPDKIKPGQVLKIPSHAGSQ